MGRIKISKLLVSGRLLTSGCGVLMEEFMEAASTSGGGGDWSVTPSNPTTYQGQRCYQTSATRQTCFR